MTVRAYEVASAEQIEDWVEQFHRRGYLFLEGYCRRRRWLHCARILMMCCEMSHHVQLSLIHI